MVGGRKESIAYALFDVGGVLLTLGEEAYRRDVAERLGLDAVPTEYESFVPALQRGEIDEGRVWAELLGREIDTDGFADLFVRHFPPNPDMIDLAYELRSMGIGTAIFSNTQTIHVQAMRAMPFLKGFHPVFFSCEMGSRKPEMQMYQLAIQRLGVPPHQIVYFDDIPEFVEAAQSLGIKAIHHAGDARKSRRRLFETMGVET